jgi:hypothetical protein
METPLDNSAAPKPAKAPEVLSLGLRDQIEFIGLYADTRSDAKLLTAHIYDGLLRPNGKRHVAKFRTGLSDPKLAFANLVPGYLKELTDSYDAKAAALGISLPKPDEGKGSVTMVAGSARARMTALHLAFSGLPKSTQVSCYMVVMRLFLKVTDTSLDKPVDEYIPEECGAIWKEMVGLSDWKSNTNTAWQNAGNMRFVARDIGFSEECVQAFKSSKHKGAHARNRILFPEEQRQMWRTLDLVSWEEEGCFLMAANGTMNTGDAVFALTEDFLEAEKCGFDAKRIKTGNPFGFFPWPRTLDWFQRREDPKAAHLFWRQLFTPEELTADPAIIYRRLAPEEMRQRKDRATNQLRACFKRFLAACEITREHVHLKNFRNTNISHWEASGVPRYLGMDASGHVKEANYTGYAEPTMAQKRSLARLTQESYENPDADCLLTHNQSVKATSTNIIASEQRIQKEISELQQATEKNQQTFIQQIERSRIESAEQAAELRDQFRMFQAETAQRFGRLEHMLFAFVKLTLERDATVSAGRNDSELLRQITASHGESPLKVLSERAETTATN